MNEMKEHLIGKIKNKKKELMVNDVRHLTDSTYVISLDRSGINFIPGQYMILGLIDSNEMREYSIYSGVHDDNLEFIIKEVNDGDVSRQLKRIQPGDFVAIDGPFGFFSVEKEYIKKRKHLFIASGTGISPFHSFVRSYSKLDYKILHGIKYTDEAYNREHFEKNRYISCVTRDKNGDFYGRVTDYLKLNPVDKETLCYLCGNSNMIYDTFDILRNQGVPSGNVFMEVYF